MAEYVLVGGIQITGMRSFIDLEYLNSFYARCEEIEIKRKLVIEDGYLCSVFELNSEDVVALKLTFPGIGFKEYSPGDISD